MKNQTIDTCLFALDRAQADISRLRRENESLTQSYKEHVASIDHLRQQLSTAHSRLLDMMQGDDGQAWKEARKYFEQHAPEALAQWRGELREPVAGRGEPVHVVFDGLPGEEGRFGPRFVELETSDGRGSGDAEWVQKGDCWHLIIPRPVAPAQSAVPDFIRRVIGAHRWTQQRGGTYSIDMTVSTAMFRDIQDWLSAPSAGEAQGDGREAWQPIDDLPEEGQWALVYWDGAYNCAFVKAGEPVQDWTNPANPNVRPHLVTHWMPLPEPPAAQQEQTNDR